MIKHKAIWPALAGYLAGLATAGVVAMLMPATPGTMASVPATTMPSQPTTLASPAPASPAAVSPAAVSPAAVSPAAVPQHAPAPLSAGARGSIEPLEARLAADPGDLLSRKQLALVLLQNQQLMAAYEHASAILGANPDDPDGLYVHGVVRLAMGHAPLAIELLDRVLARYPDHVLALRARADAQRKIGDEGGAALTEARAREAARGDDTSAPLRGPEVEQLLAAASDGTLLEMMRSDTVRSPPSAAPAEADADDG